jgi:hypothetical protein
VIPLSGVRFSALGGIFMSYFNRYLIFLSVAVLIGFSANVFSDEKEVKRTEVHYNLGKGGLALQGYDPVSYFKEGGGVPKKGKSSITHKIGKTTYRFATTVNRDRFKSAPSKYEPAYGGWCAYAMGSDGSKVKINPKSFLVTDEKLFLFYKTLIADTRKSWNKKVNTLKPKADTNWKKVVGTK